MPQYPHATRNPKPPAAPPGGIGEFLEEARRVCRLRPLSIHTEESYVQTIRRFIHFHDKKHPARLGMPEVRAYLSHLATERNVAASTQNSDPAAAVAGALSPRTTGKSARCTTKT